jgi:hypothetical protein
MNLRRCSGIGTRSSALPQRLPRLFSSLQNHIGAIKYFICHYNKVIIRLAESTICL